MLNFPVLFYFRYKETYKRQHARLHVLNNTELIKHFLSRRKRSSATTDGSLTGSRRPSHVNSLGSRRPSAIQYHQISGPETMDTKANSLKVSSENGGGRRPSFSTPPVYHIVIDRPREETSPTFATQRISDEDISLPPPPDFESVAI